VTSGLVGVHRVLMGLLTWGGSEAQMKRLREVIGPLEVASRGAGKGEVTQGWVVRGYLEEMGRETREVCVLVRLSLFIMSS
jgi:hypothetical protein